MLTINHRCDELPNGSDALCIHVLLGQSGGFDLRLGHLERMISCFHHVQFVPSSHLLGSFSDDLTLVDSEPEPDVAVIKGQREQIRLAHPGTAEVVVEVSVSAESLDRVKLDLYAGAGVRECGLVLAESRVIGRHCEPKGAVYQRMERVEFPGSLESTVFSAVMLPPAGLFA